MKGQNWPLSDTENIVKISRYFLNIAISRYFQMMQYIALAIYRDTKCSSLIATAISLGWKSQTLPLLLMVHWPTPTIAISAHCSREEARAEQAGPQTFLSCNTLKVLAAQLVKNDQSKALINWLVNYPVWMHTQKTTEFHWSHYSINTIAIQPSSNWTKS